MASSSSSSFGAATASAAAASLKENAHKSSAHLPLFDRHFALRANSDRVSFRLSPSPKLRFSSKGLQYGWNGSSVVKSQLNEVGFPHGVFNIKNYFQNFRSLLEKILEISVAFKDAVGGSPKAATSSPSETKDVQLPNEAPLTALATEESISGFITQVASLVKLVDSKDIVELKLKQLDCEILIRKKEALPQPPSLPVTHFQSQPQPAVLPPPSTPSPAPTPTPAPSRAPTPALSPPKAQPSKSSHTPLKCPMAGTFYRSPGPGEPPFVKVGDKVKKGQVICIIEAMKLMNEIEADQSGTVVEVVAADGKPVSIDTHLFVIEPNS